MVGGMQMLIFAGAGIWPKPKTKVKCTWAELVGGIKTGRGDAHPDFPGRRNSDVQVSEFCMGG